MNSAGCLDSKKLEKGIEEKTEFRDKSASRRHLSGAGFGFGILSEDVMRFVRKLLKDWVEMQLASSNADCRCIGHNFLIEENVSDERRLELETHNLDWADARKLLVSYSIHYVQGGIRGSLPSTFMMRKNRPALQRECPDRC